MVDQLYRKHYSTLYQYGCLVHGNRDGVEDVIQNFFVWTMENPQKFSRIKNFEVFACQSVRRNLIQKLIKENSKKENHNKFFLKGALDKNHSSVEDEIIHLEQEFLDKQNLKLALEQLPDRQKEIIYLKYYANKSYEEIEEIMSVSNQVARNYLSRALKKLKSTIQVQGVCYITLILLLS